MLSGDPIEVPAAAVAEAKAYLRVELAGEDPLIERLVGAAAELCEQFTGRALLARGFSELVPASAAWKRLAATPVLAITAVEALPPDGAASALAAGSYAVDIDANGDGWVRVTQVGEAKRVRVAYQAGLATDWPELPGALRQGMLRLAAHCYAHRERADDSGPPAAVTALWRPWRRLRVA
ncbi:MAG TPA: hypothetical protein VGW34_04510 [Allosphingosinicella sp.]|nr:hypothetical protein [Allosphingosinicella sp.]